MIIVADSELVSRRKTDIDREATLAGSDGSSPLLTKQKTGLVDVLSQKLIKLLSEYRAQRALEYLSGNNIDAFAALHPDLSKYIGAIGSVYSGCERVKLHPGKRVNLVEAYEHILACSICRERFESLRRSRESYEHPKSKSV